MSTKILSYRGLIANGGQDTILLSTKKGEKGYRITKFELMPPAPGTAHAEWVSKIYSDEPANIDGLVDFSDNRLLGANYMVENPNTTSPVSIVTIFDQQIFNQDIYITLVDVNASLGCNYYLELEVIPLNEMEATVATLKDIRNNA
jgi:hypothetical protein